MPRKTIHKPELQCSECNVVGMCFSSFDYMNAPFDGTVLKVPRFFHVCENCGHEFRGSYDKCLNLRIRFIFLAYIRKYK